MFGKTEQAQTTGANLFNEKTVVNGFVSGNGSLQPGNQGVNKERTSDYILLPEFETRITAMALGEPLGNTDTSYLWIGLSFYDEGKNFILRTDSKSAVGEKKYTLTGTIPQEAKYVRLSYRKYNDVVAMLNAGSVALPYEPYTGGKPSPSQEYLQPIETTKKGIVTVDFTDSTNHQKVDLNCPREFTKWDKLEKVDGVWNWVYKSKKVKSTEMNAKGLHSSGAIMIGNEFRLKELTHAFCDKLIHTSAGVSEMKNGEFKIAFGNIYIKIDEVISKEEAFQFLSENEFLIIAESTDAEYIPLPQAEQDKLNALTMYAPNTEVTNTGGCNMELTYTVNTKSYVDAKIAEVSTAIVQKGI